MYWAFYNSKNITGDIYIYSTAVYNCSGCFSGDLAKTVHIPFTHPNGVNTSTYNSFINLYGSGQNGVTLVDLNSEI